MGVVVAKRRTVVTFGLVFRRRISNVLTVTGIGGVLVAKRRTVVTFGRGSFSLLGDRRERSGERKRGRRGERIEERRDR